MRIDNILQFIVPLTFLAIWALTSLFNREAQPLPPRSGRPPGPPGPRPAGAPMPPRPPVRRSEPSPNAPPTRWQPANSSGRPVRPRQPSRLEDDIVILDSEPKRPPVPPPPPPRAGGGVSSPRRTGRNRSTPAQQAKRPDSATPRALSASLAQESAAQMSRPLELNPLAGINTPLSTQQSHDVAESTWTTIPSTSSNSPAKLLAVTPEKLREAIILNELLQPPLALRRRRPGHS